MQKLIEYAKTLFEVEIKPEQAEQFQVLARELQEWNRNRVNLTAIDDDDGIIIRHFLDSISLVRVADFKPYARLMDVGTGAGFPGLVIAILFPEVEVTLMESTGKKVDFIQHIIDTLGLKNSLTLHARAEEAGQMDVEREQYDIVTARAVARLPALLEYMLPLNTIGGLSIAMKGETAAQESVDAKRALKVLGGRLKGIEEIRLPERDQAHYLVVVEKTQRSPSEFPRRPGIPTRQPL